MYISSSFDAGNIEVLDASRPSAVRLKIRPDAGGDHYQWFYFRVIGARDLPLVLQIENAAGASFPRGWEGYRACWSSDLTNWQRTDCAYDGTHLCIRISPPSDSIWIAYFAPYSHERHMALVASSISRGASYERLGSTVDGRDIDLIKIGTPAGKPYWIIARQHPGETMAEWLMEGLIDRLLCSDDPVAARLRAESTFYLVPNMNPDGSYRGHLRNNAAGVNLNRQWDAPSRERSPEVLHVRQRMEETGVEFFLDVHGDETLPYNFIAGAEGIPSWTTHFSERQQKFLQAFVLASPDFQTKHGYPVPAPGRANLAIATNWMAERFGCLSMTLEQPFKDTIDHPQPNGWTPERARKLGWAVLSAMWSSQQTRY